MSQEVRRGQVYKHYKGSTYRILHVGKHTETGETMIIYHKIDGTPDVWVRPLGIFGSLVMKDGQAVPRFSLL